MSGVLYQLPDSPLERAADKFMQEAFVTLCKSKQFGRYPQSDMSDLIRIYYDQYAAVFVIDRWKLSARANLCVVRLLKDSLFDYQGRSAFADYVVPDVYTEQQKKWVLARLTFKELRECSVPTEDYERSEFDTARFVTEIARRRNAATRDINDDFGGRSEPWVLIAGESVAMAMSKVKPTERASKMDEMKALFLSTAHSSNYDDHVLDGSDTNASQKLSLCADISILRIVYFHRNVMTEFISYIASIMASQDNNEIIAYGLRHLSTRELYEARRTSDNTSKNPRSYYSLDRIMGLIKFELDLRDPSINHHNLQPPSISPPQPPTESQTPPIVQQTGSRMDERRNKHAIQIKSVDNGASTSVTRFTLSRPTIQPVFE